MAKNEERADAAPAPAAPEEGATSGRMTAAEREEALVRQRALGKRLKPLWETVVNEELPDDFLSILDKMGPDEGKAGSQ